MDKNTLMTACTLEDYTTVRECGWLTIYEGLKTWWSKRFTLPDLKPYVDVLGGEDPDTILNALYKLKGEEWRPPPSKLYRAFQESQATPPTKTSPVDAYGQRKRPDQMPATLARVRWLLAEGHDGPCECIPRPVQVKKDNFNVLRCPMCGGIEAGQVYAAEDEVDF